MESKFLILLSLLEAASPAGASCAYGTALHRRQEGEIEVNTFGYTGAIGPANWVDLDPAANALCSTGTSQSPVDMTAGAFSMVPASALGLTLEDMTEGAEFENLGTTVEVVAREGEGEAAVSAGAMSFQGVDYTLAQFHFHLPSEHLDDGASMAMETHFVWESAEGDIAVVGVWIDLDDESPGAGAGAGANATAPAPVVRRSSKHERREETRHRAAGKRDRRQSLPPVEGSFFHVSAPTTAAVTASPLLETVLSSVGEIATPGTVTRTQPLALSEVAAVLNSGSFQTYSGSLTTPPCSEGVRWLVSNQKLSIQTSTYLAARNVIGFNARFPQNVPGEANVLSK